MSQRTEALASALEQGARALATFAGELTDEEWQTPLPHDGRKIGIVVHHVATVYPLEIMFARSVAAGKPEPITGEAINQMNAGHAKQNDAITKQETLQLLATNSADAAAAIRKFTDEELDAVAPVPIYGNAPLTCQFVLEDHAVRHSFHHLARIEAALKSRAAKA
ncbi:MAG TPA: DinB family protein [Pyrinomonadaceae bacterium]|nr:DinB family protein [Pyrinomonadaceae bacterium]